MIQKENDKYRYGEENNLNLKLVIAIRRSLQPEENYLTSLLSEAGLTLPQFGVLESLYHVGPMNINQIIEKTLSTSGNMTVVIKNLVNQGCITKDKDPEDGRACIIRITKKGYDLIESIFPTHLDGLQSFFSSLDLEEKKELLRLMKKLNRYDKD